MCSVAVCSTINELEAQLDYERIRRERLEAQLDEYRREIAYLNSLVEEATHQPVSHLTESSTITS